MPTINASESYELMSTYGIYDRDVARKLNIKYPRASALSWMDAAKGYKGKAKIGTRKTNRHEYSYWEENQWLNASADIASASNSGNDVVLTLASGAHQNSGKESYPIVTDICVFPDQTHGLVIAVNKSVDSAHTVTVRKLNASQDVQTAGAAGGVVVFYSNAQKEESSAPESRIPKQTKITNYLQTIRNKYKWTDHSDQNVTEFEYKGSKKLHIKGMDDTINLQRYQEEVALLITPLSASLTDAGGNKIQTTNALIPQITATSGGEFSYTTKPDLDDVEGWMIEASDQYAGQKYLMGMGINFHSAWNRFMVDFMVENPAPFFSTESDTQKFTFNIGQIQWGDFDIYMNKWDVLSHKDTLGAAGHPYRDMAVCIPIGDTRDPDSGDNEPYIKMAYADPGGSAKENKGDHKLWQTGANAINGATDDILNTNVHIVSYKGLEVRHLNKFFVWTKA